MGDHGVVAGLHSVTIMVYCDRSMLNAQRAARHDDDIEELVPLHVAPSLASLLLLLSIVRLLLHSV